MAEYFSASKINRMMKAIKTELDIVVPTDLHTVQQTYSRIIHSSGERRGEVRTYGETVEYLKSYATKYHQPYREFTVQQYQKQMRELSNLVRPYSSAEIAQDTYRDGARQLIEAYNEATGGNIDIDTLDFATLKKVIDEATEAMGKRDKDRSDSPKLFKYMHQYFAEEGVRNIGETPQVDD